MTADEDWRARARAMRFAALGALVISAQTAVLVVGRPGRTGPSAAGVAGVLAVAYLHLIRYVSGRPITRGPMKGFSWADSYRVTDAMGRGEAITDPALAGPALRYADQMRRVMRAWLVLGPFFVLSVVLRHSHGDVDGRRLAYDLASCVILGAFGVRWLIRRPRLAQAAERTRALHGG